MPNNIEDIKSRLNIVDVISGYIKLQKAGANFRAVCPFHSEKKPSLFVSPARQIWHCFGCGVGGDIFGFVKQIEGVEFGDALKILAQKAGVELRPVDPQLKTERNRLYEICELTCRFFEKQLEASSTGKEAKEYLLKRGISQDSLAQWRVGYAPDVWQGLSDFLASRGYSEREIEKAGVGLTSEKGSFYDRFRGRIIFPVFDLNSQVIGFGGRVFKEKDKQEVAKYVNTPQTMLYDKSRTLYGLDKAKVVIRKKDTCILVEGYIDAMMSLQAGVDNVVAVSGTALTAFQLQILKRYSNNLLLSFDMDIAGDSATKRGIDLAQNQGFDIKIVRMPAGKDPADIISENAASWPELIGQAKSILEFYFESAFANYDSTNPEGKREISKIILPVVKRIPNKIEQDHWIQELSRRLGVKETAVVEEMKKTKAELPVFLEGPAAEPAPAVAPLNRRELLEERIAALVLKDPDNLSLIAPEYLLCFSSKIQIVLTGLKENTLDQKDDFINYLYLKAEVESEGLNCTEEVAACVKEIKRLEFKEKLDSISHEIKKAEEEKDGQKVSDLSRKFRDMASELNIL